MKTTKSASFHYITEISIYFNHSEVYGMVFQLG